MNNHRFNLQLIDKEGRFCMISHIHLYNLFISLVFYSRIFYVYDRIMVEGHQRPSAESILKVQLPGQTVHVWFGHLSY